VALTAVADAPLLLTLQFPPSKEKGKRVEEAISRELAGRLLAPSIVLTEFVKIAGARIGESAALLRLNLLKERGMRVIPLGEELALVAGRLLLSSRHPYRRRTHCISREDRGSRVRHHRRPTLSGHESSDQVGLKCPHRREGACDQPLPGGKSTPHPSGREPAAGYPMISIYSARTYLSALLV